MAYYADLHIHSKYSRATSKHCDLEHLAYWARMKGIAVVGTGDFTHPAWREELKDKLVPAEPGLFRLRPDLERAVGERLPRACQGIVRFLLSVEVSTIYKRGPRTRKIHHLIYAPDLDSAERVVAGLARIGNLHSDGRPILGLDSRHLLEIVLESGRDCYLVPAHIWTPWFAALGSKSGFDSIADCYGDLAPHIFAVETGLSSDPAMNWSVSSLDRYRLVSNSDAHSPDKLGREACAFDGELSYYGIRSALETGDGYLGTVEFFPEEGKYHLDGHRKCDVRLSPVETRALEGRCPVCSSPLTVGVMHRVEELADRPDAAPPDTAGDVRSFVPLPEILAEIHGVGARSQAVGRDYRGLLGRLGPELEVLGSTPLDEIQAASSSLLAEGIARLRDGRVRRDAGFDGEYGTIRLFEEEELLSQTRGGLLFELPPEPAAERVESTAPSPAAASVPPVAEPEPAPPLETGAGSDLLAGLDEDQRRAAAAGGGPLLVVAGPGSGKTRTLTHRIAHLVRDRGVDPAQCLAITFTRRAAEELRSRLQVLLPGAGAAVTVSTFHGLGLSILKEERAEAGLQRGFRVATEPERVALVRELGGCSERAARRTLGVLSRHKRAGAGEPGGGAPACSSADYQGTLEARNLLDYDDLVVRTADLLESNEELRERYRARYPWIFLDEYQDVDEQQVRLVSQLVPPGGNLCAIGDPDQAIYGFRGADVRFFHRFPTDFPGAREVRLRRNYRSGRPIVEAAGQVIAAAGGGERSLPVQTEGLQVLLHEAPTEKAEAEFAVRSIEEWIGGHSFFSIDSGRSAGEAGDELSFSDFAVLYRTEAQAPAVVEAFERSGMPFQRRSHAPLTAHPGVPPLVEGVLAREDGADLSARLRSAAADAIASAERDDPPRVAALRAGLELLEPVASTRGDDLEGFLADLATGAEADAWDPRADRISLLTLHAAKGLEFAVVFLVGCEAGILPLSFGGPPGPEEEAEERRLFYVGMTRARRRLCLCRARRRPWRGKPRDMEPSPYWSLIEERLLERESAGPAARARGERGRQLELY